MKNILILCLIISQLLVYSCARKKTLTSDELCTQQIKQAEAQQTTLTELDTKLKTIITNLITAAKIHQQHNEHMLCLEKIQRALTLQDAHKPAKT